MKPKRFISWWITWPDLDWTDPENYDKIRRRADALAESCVTDAYTFGAHFRWDWLPFFELLHDYLATVAQELHERGIGLIDHHSVELVHRYRTREEAVYMMHNSGPHLPIGPSFEAAASWEFRGHKLNDWRSIDVTTGEPLYYPQYQSEGFCHRNPEFIAGYCEYVKKLLADTGIDGLEDDDSLHFAGYRSCGCRYCRAAFRERTGIELPPHTDSDFWGNWDNPAWSEWIDLRLESSAIFQKAVKSLLPPDFPQASCCPGGARFSGNDNCSDAVEFIKGCTWQNQELSGNVPPYSGDKLTSNPPMFHHIANASYNMGAARSKNARCVGGGYAFTEATGNVLWALARCLGADCWSSTLKARLGLPRRILATLPDDALPPRKSFRFEAAHEELYDSREILQAGVYYSAETRRHTHYGNLATGYGKDFSDCLQMLLKAGIAAGTLHEIPENTDLVPVLVIPGAARFTAAEMEKLQKFTASGGKVVACGACGIPGADSPWKFPNRISMDFWQRPPNFRPLAPGSTWAWEFVPVERPDLSGAAWQELAPGVIYNPHSASDEEFQSELLEKIRPLCKPLPFVVSGHDGFYGFVRETDDSYIVQFLACDYDTDVDHELENMRQHRTRVNFIVKAEPLNTSRLVKLSAAKETVAYAPFNDEAPAVTAVNGGIEVKVPEKCVYMVLKVTK